MKNCQNPVKRAKIPHSCLTIGDYTHILGEQPHNLPREGEQKNSCEHCIHNSHEQCHPHTFFHTIIFACSIVLSDKSRDGHAEAQHRKNVKAVNLQICAESCHRRCPILINACLNQYIGKGNDHILDSGRQTYLDNTQRHRFMNPKIFQRNAVIRRNPEQEPQCQNAGDCLAEVGRNGCSCHTDLQACNQQQIHKNIDHSRCCQIHQRSSGISCRIQNSSRHIINHIKNQSIRINPQITGCIIQDFRRCIHHHQQLPAKQNTACCQNQSQNDRDCHRCMYRLMKPLFLFRSKILGNDHSCAYRSSQAECNQQID